MLISYISFTILEVKLCFALNPTEGDTRDFLESVPNLLYIRGMNRTSQDYTLRTYEYWSDTIVSFSVIYSYPHIVPTLFLFRENLLSHGSSEPIFTLEPAGPQGKGEDKKAGDS